MQSEKAIAKQGYAIWQHMNFLERAGMANTELDAWETAISLISCMKANLMFLSKSCHCTANKSHIPVVSEDASWSSTQKLDARPRMHWWCLYNFLASVAFSKSRDHSCSRPSPDPPANPRSRFCTPHRFLCEHEAPSEVECKSGQENRNLWCHQLRSMQKCLSYMEALESLVENIWKETSHCCGPEAHSSAPKVLP